MTKIITRCYDSAEKARLVRHELIEIQKNSRPGSWRSMTPPRISSRTLTEAHVQAATATAYEKHVARGGAVVLVRAGYRPLGVAQTTRDVADAMGALDLSDLVEEVYLKEGPEPLSGKILLDHPRLLTRDRVPGSTTYHMADWPIPPDQPAQARSGNPIIPATRTYGELADPADQPPQARGQFRLPAPRAHGGLPDPPDQPGASPPTVFCLPASRADGELADPASVRPQALYRHMDRQAHADGQLALPAAHQWQDRDQRDHSGQSPHGKLPDPASE